MFKRILVANRGEIAQRVIRCCIEMGIESVAAYSKPDENEMYVPFATSSICIGGAAPKDSYLNIDNILSAALATGCDAVHPGYGFLSENVEFARRCEELGLKFIGPPASVIEKMGVKATARSLMKEAGVPVVPGSDGCVSDWEQAESVAASIGYPVLVKASAGGGGRGMRRVEGAGEMQEMFEQARSEAQACFADGSLYVEKLIEHPKHVEFQIFADSRGNVVHMGERDCSIQRKNQKMMEEAPCPQLTPELRAEMGEVAVRAARAAGYVNAGTVEFVLDSEGRYYFIEMNTRIQVEHPVTEMIYGIDLVREQIRVAAGLPLSVEQAELVPKGHAIECRINAEDPMRGFLPSPGRINLVHIPSGNGTRVDSAIYSGYEISPFYDSLVAKVVTWAPTRLECVRKMRRSLEELTLDGIKTTQEFELFILFHGRFLKGNYNTGFLEECIQDLLELERQVDEAEGEGEGEVAGVPAPAAPAPAALSAAAPATADALSAAAPSAGAPATADAPSAAAPATAAPSAAAPSAGARLVRAQPSGLAHTTEGGE